MSRKLVLLITLTLVLIGMLGVPFEVRRVEASETIYIRADGSIEGTTDISTVDNVTYTFTGNINDTIVVERDNIVVDGAGYTLQGTGSGTGINLTRRSNITIKNMEIKTFQYCILLDSSSFNTISRNNIANNSGGIGFVNSSDNSISENNITNNDYGIVLGDSSNNNTLSGNNLVNNTVGIYLYYSTHNHIYGNNIINNEVGVFIWGCSDNVFYHNNFINNTQQVFFWSSVYANFWDNGVDGNYWRNYTGVDSNYDGIGDSWYNITQDNTDHYPLMGNFSAFTITHQEETYHVTTICDSIISDFQFNGTAISFNVTGPDYTLGFCRVTIPNILVQDLWQGNYRVLVDGEEPVMTNNWTDGTYTYLYFIYVLSEHKVEIVPEFPTWTSILLILIVLTVAIAITKRKLPKTPIH